MQKEISSVVLQQQNQPHTDTQPQQLLQYDNNIVILQQFNDIIEMCTQISDFAKTKTKSGEWNYRRYKLEINSIKLLQQFKKLQNSQQQYYLQLLSSLSGKKLLFYRQDFIALDNEHFVETIKQTLHKFQQQQFSKWKELNKIQQNEYHDQFKIDDTIFRATFYSEFVQKVNQYQPILDIQQNNIYNQSIYKLNLNQNNNQQQYVQSQSTSLYKPKYDKSYLNTSMTIDRSISQEKSYLQSQQYIQSQKAKHEIRSKMNDNKKDLVCQVLKGNFFGQAQVGFQQFQTIFSKLGFGDIQSAFFDKLGFKNVIYNNEKQQICVDWISIAKNNLY